MNDTINYFSLPNGLRAVHYSCAGNVEYCGLSINVGSRDEAPGREGLAHFVEHTIFKGTSHRRSYHIVNRMESVGGELNAYTSKEETVVYSCFPKGHLARAVELISDLVSSSVFPAAELEREREVVTDEINSYLDSPADAVFDEFDDRIFAGSSLGHNILGTVESLSGLTSDICREYLSEWFVPGDMAFFYFGPSKLSDVERVVSRYFRDMESRRSPVNRSEPPVLAPFDEYLSLDCHQSHTLMGARIGGMGDPLRYAVSLLTNIIGGPGMNSLLNVALREKRGLVYTVDASTAAYSDCGLFTIYFGCDHSDVKKCRRIVSDILNRIANDGISPRLLERAKRQYIGQLAVASENHEQMATGMGRSLLYRGHVNDPQETIERIMAITGDEMLKAGAMLAPSGCSVLTLG